MGQLEKYGLYVLCLVIFLILGVTIWGGGDVPPVRRVPPTTGLNASTTAGQTGGETAPGSGSVMNLQALLQPAIQPAAPRDRDARPVDATSNRETANGVLNPGGGKESDTAATDPVKPPVQAPTPPQPEPASRTYKVKAGDSFDSIAKSQLGDSGMRTEIMRLNPSIKPERLQIGATLVLPAAAGEARKSTETRADAPVATLAVASYTVGKGDTFEHIARRQLGDRRRVGELRELNPDIDPTRLRVGQKIRLPKN